MAQTRSFSGLNWVRAEIEEVIRQARDALEEFAEGGEESSVLKPCIAQLTQARGVLDMLQIQGAARLADEMRMSVQALVEEKVSNGAEAAEALMLSMIQLPDYLEKLEAGGEDIPLLLLPTINDLRTTRGAPPISESNLVISDMARVGGRSVADQSARKNLRLAAHRARPKLHKGLIGWFRGSDIAGGLASLRDVFAELEKLADCEPMLRGVFRTANAVAEGLIDGSVATDNKVKGLVGRVDRVTKELEKHGVRKAVANLPQDVVKELLVHVARSNSDNPVIRSVKQDYQLDNVLPDEETLTQARMRLFAPNADALAGMREAAIKELLPIKDTLDLYMRGGRDRGQLLDLEGPMRRLASTLGMAGMDDLSERLKGRADDIQSIGSGKVEADDTLLMRVAGDLLFVESSLDNVMVHVNSGSSGLDADGNTAEMRNLFGRTLQEASLDMSKAKESIVSFLDNPSNTDSLKTVPGLLHGVAGALRVISHADAADLLDRASGFIQLNLLESRAAPGMEVLEALADAISGTEYYMEAVSEGRGDMGEILKTPAAAVEALEAHAQDLMPASGFSPVDDSVKDVADPSQAKGLADSAQEQKPAADVSEPVLESVSEGSKPSTAVPVAEDFDPEIMEIFLEEANEELEVIQTEYGRWRNNQEASESLSAFRRSFHTLKGSGRLAGANIIGEYAWSVESLLNRVIDQTIEVDDRLLRFMDDATDVLPELIAAQEQMRLPTVDVEPLKERAKAIAEGRDEPEQVAAPVVDVPSMDSALAEEPEALNENAIELTLEDSELLDIFQAESHEHIAYLNGFLDTCRSQPDAACEMDNEVVRALHTLAGSARMAEVEPLAVIAKALEKKSNVLLDAGLAVDQAFIRLLSDGVAEMSNMLESLHRGSVRVADPADLAARIEAYVPGAADDGVAVESPDDDMSSSGIVAEDGASVEFPGAGLAALSLSAADLAELDASPEGRDAAESADAASTVEMDRIEADPWGSQSLGDLEIQTADDEESTPLGLDEPVETPAADGFKEPIGDVSEEISDMAGGQFDELVLDETSTSSDLLGLQADDLPESVAEDGLALADLDLPEVVEVDAAELGDFNALSSDEPSIQLDEPEQPELLVEAADEGLSFDIETAEADEGAADGLGLSEPDEMSISADQDERLGDIDLEVLIDSREGLDDQLPADTQTELSSAEDLADLSVEELDENLTLGDLPVAEPADEALPDIQAETLDEALTLGDLDAGEAESDGSPADVSDAGPGDLDALYPADESKPESRLGDLQAPASDDDSEAEIPAEDLLELEPQLGGLGLVDQLDEVSTDIPAGDLDESTALEEFDSSSADDEQDAQSEPLALDENIPVGDLPSEDTGGAAEGIDEELQLDDLHTSPAPGGIGASVQVVDETDAELTLGGVEIPHLDEGLDLEDIAAEMPQQPVDERADVGEEKESDEGEAVPPDFMETPVTETEAGGQDFGQDSPGAKADSLGGSADSEDAAQPPADGRQLSAAELDLDPELREIFLEESQEILERLDDGLRDWHVQPANHEHANLLQRSLHTLKGSARLTGIASIGDLSHSLENLIQGMRDSNQDATSDQLNLAQKVVDKLSDQVDAVRLKRPVPTSDDLIDELQKAQVVADKAETDEALEQVEALNLESEDREPVDVDPELVEIFIEEARDLLDQLDNELQEWESDPDLDDGPTRVKRTLHTLKGSARLAGIQSIGNLAHALESLLEGVTPEMARSHASLFPLAHRAADRLSDQVDEVQTAGSVRKALDLIAELEYVHQELSGEPLSEQLEADSVAEQGYASAELQAQQAEPQALDAQPAQRGQTGQEQVRVRSELLNRLVNNAGEISIYRARLEQQNLALGFNLNELEQTVTRLHGQLRQMDIETEAQILYRYDQEKEEAGDLEEDFDPLELDRFSTIQQLSRSLIETVNDLASIQNLLGDQQKESETLLLQHSRISNDLQDGLLRTRMLPFSHLVPRLHRLVRQTAASLGKRAVLEVFGAEGEMDRGILDRMLAPLEHILRNAVSHGIESPEVRLQNGKEEAGKVSIYISRDGNDVVIMVSDDGAGLNLAAIRKKAEDRGLLEAGAKVDDDDVMQLVLEPGFSTVKEVTQISGRGVGTDVVVSEVKQLGGTLDIDSQPGRGTSFSIRLPFTLAISEALLVALGDDVFAVPHVAIEGVVRIGHDELVGCYEGRQPGFKYAGHDYQVRYLGDLLGTQARNIPEGAKWLPLLLVRSGEHRIAIQIDQVMGNRQIVVKSVGQQLSTVRWISGGTILADGRVALILDVSALVRMDVVHSAQAERVVEPEEVIRQVQVMVVDDSITVRKVTERLLKRHNMEVITAKDGVDAVATLQDEHPDVMLLDVEMPRMDGYELARHMRSSGELADIPIIMITSRTGQKHRDIAMSLGVKRYLGKPYQEGDLLENIYAVLAEVEAGV